MKQDNFKIGNGLPAKEFSKIIKKCVPLGQTVKQFISNDTNTLITKSYVGNFN
jgi:hypothetical protein